MLWLVWFAIGDVGKRMSFLWFFVFMSRAVGFDEYLEMNFAQALSFFFLLSLYRNLTLLAVGSAQTKETTL